MEMKKRLFINQKLLMVVIIVFLSSLFGCRRESPETNGENADAELIQINTQTASPFAPYYKIYYLKPADWGKSGLEQDESIIENTNINKIKLDEDAHVISLEIFDYDVCDYVEEYAYSIDDEDNVKTYCIISDRQGNCMGVVSGKWDWDCTYGRGYRTALEDRIMSKAENQIDSFSSASEYAPPYQLYDFNEDGHIDIYSDENNIYLWTEEGYELCSYKEVTDIDFFQNGEWMKIEGLEEFKDSCVESIRDSSEGNGEWLSENKCIYWGYAYAQFSGIPNAEKINGQIEQEVKERFARYKELVKSSHVDESEDALQETKDGTVRYSVGINAEDIIYYSKNYLVVKVTYTIDREMMTQYKEEIAGFQYMTFELETGNLMTVADILGKDYTLEQIIELAWKGYKRSMEEVPGQYVKEKFDNYYKWMFEEEYFHYYFTDEGMMISYGDGFGYLDEKIPVVYCLNERLEAVLPTDIKKASFTGEYEFNEKVLRTLCPWEDICNNKNK